MIKKQAEIIIKENNEPLVEIRETSRIRLGLKGLNYETLFFVRKSVAEKLILVSKSLPEGINLLIIEGYRTTEAQQKLWSEEYKKIKSVNPSWTDEEIERQTRMVIAKPDPLANHHCGGALDLTLVYSDGLLVDMGGPYISSLATEEDRDKFPMMSEHITENQAQNRKILRDAMTAQDFAWYGNEWWHYCYGDRMWATYIDRNECFYGSIEINQK